MVRTRQQKRQDSGPSEQKKRLTSRDFDSGREGNPTVRRRMSAKEDQDPNRKSLLIGPLTQQERDVLSEKLNPVEMNALVKQFNTDDEIVRLGQRYSLAKFSVHFSIAMSTVLFEVPEYETVKFLKRRLVKYGLGKGVFLSSIDRIYLESKEDETTGIQKMLLEERDTNMLETFLYNLGFRGGNLYHLRLGFKSNKGDDVVEKTLIEEAKSRDLPSAIHGIPCDDNPDVEDYQKILQGDHVDDVQYDVIASEKHEPPPAEPTTKSQQVYSGNITRYGDKWNQDRLNAMIVFLTSDRQFDSDREAFLELLKENENIFPTLKDENHNIANRRKAGEDKSLFTVEDIKDKWRNIVGTRTSNPDNTKSLGVFDRKSAKCDLDRLKNSRTLVLEDLHIQMIESYLRRQPEYEGPLNA